MTFIFELLITFFLIVSGIFGFVGSFGMIKLKEPMSRLHAPTKATTLGVGGVLLASIAHSVLLGQIVPARAADYVVFVPDRPNHGSVHCQMVHSPP